MDSTKQNPESLLPLTPAVLHILLALADGREQHGYSIMLKIVAQTQGKFRIGPTTLYRSIKRMLEQDMIVETGERPIPHLMTNAVAITASHNLGGMSCGLRYNV